MVVCNFVELENKQLYCTYVFTVLICVLGYLEDSVYPSLKLVMSMSPI